MLAFIVNSLKISAKSLDFLCNLLAKDVAFVFDECLKAFEKLEAMLTSDPIIQPPNWEEAFEIVCDASDHAVGAVLG